VPIAGARVTITNKNTGQTSSVETDAAGNFTSSALATTDYDLRIGGESFITRASVTVPAETPLRRFHAGPEPVAGVLPPKSSRAHQRRNFLSFAQLGGVQSRMRAQSHKNGFSSLSFDGQFGCGPNSSRQS
jgi:hypothetical protein